MTFHYPVDVTSAAQPAPARLPPAAWVLGLSCIAGQLLQLAEVGPKQTDDGLLLSAVVGAVVTPWVVSGVLRGRMLRLVFAGVVLGLGLLGYLVECADGGVGAVFGWDGLQLLVSVVSVAALVWFLRTDYFAWRRRNRAASGPSLAPLLAVAVLVGLLGGVVDTPERSGIWVRVNV